MNYREMKESIESAEETLRLADEAATDLAKMLIGRLRKVKNRYHNGTIILNALKKELSEYNGSTQNWKS